MKEKNTTLPELFLFFLDFSSEEDLPKKKAFLRADLLKVWKPLDSLSKEAEGQTG